MRRTVKKLSSLEIDEVSLVDRPANQHGLVAIAKRQEQDMPGIFDADGNEVDEEDLGHGDFVYDEAGTEFVYIETEDEGAEEHEYEDASVGKGFLASGPLKEGGSRLGLTARARSGSALRSGRKLANRGVEEGGKLASRVGEHASNYAPRYALGGAGVGGAAGGYATGRRGKASKSLGDQVLEELSKALTDDSRDEVIAKAMDAVEEIAKRNADLEETVYSLIDERDQGEFIELAKGYELPIDEAELGGLLHRAAQVLPPEDVAKLDRLFSATGEIAKHGFTQLGYDGYAESDVLSQMYAAAGEIVAKSDASLTQEQAVTALFAQNPAAYEEYEAEQRRNR